MCIGMYYVFSIRSRKRLKQSVPNWKVYITQGKVSGYFDVGIARVEKFIPSKTENSIQGKKNFK